MSSDWHQQVSVVVVIGSRCRSHAPHSFPREGGLSCPSPTDEQIVVRGSLPVVIVGNFCSSMVNSVLITLLLSLPMRGIWFSQNTQKIEPAVENKSSIEGAEVEGALHHGLRNVKNANYP